MDTGPTMQPPHDADTEAALLGALMLSPLAIDHVRHTLTASDFYRPAHGHVYDAVLALHARGEMVDAVTVRDYLTANGLAAQLGDQALLLQLMADAGPVTTVPAYARIILDRALRRRLMLEGLALAQQASDLASDAGETLEVHQALVASMGNATLDYEPDDMAIEDFLQRPRSSVSPWVVHGLVRRQHKIMIVGGEGAGKSWVLRFVAMCAAYGVQPFRHTKTAPVRTLIIDLENPEDALFDSFETILKQVATYNPQQQVHNRLWWRPAGINLRNRLDVAELENVIRARRPDLVCLGPLYASYENGTGDFGWETAARQVQVVLKDLMVRYNFGLLIEDHAPQSDSKGKRDMRPYGSSLWRRWPEVGIGMEPVEGRSDAFRLARWRGDRVPMDWPTWLVRGSASKSPWPFVGVWDDELPGQQHEERF